MFEYGQLSVQSEPGSRLVIVPARCCGTSRAWATVEPQIARIRTGGGQAAAWQLQPEIAGLEADAAGT